MALSTEVDQLAKELSGLRQEFDGIKSIVSGWSGGAGTDPYFDYLRARDGFFDKPINQSARLFSANVYSIANANWTNIGWDKILYNNNLLRNHSTGAGSTNITLRLSTSDTVLIVGFVEFAVNSSGFRGVLSGSTSAPAIMAQLPAFANGSCILPFAIGVNLNVFSTSISIAVFQNSGANLDVLSADILLIRAA